MKQKNKREIQREERRQQILECSLDMIISKGFEAMKIRDIAEKLNISTGLFFNYFESKEQVYEELVKIGLSGPADVIAMKTDNIDPIEMFEKIAAHIFESLRLFSITGKMFLLMAQLKRPEIVPDNVKQLIAHFDPVTPLLDKVAEGQAKGLIKQGDKRALVMAFWGAVQGIAESYALSEGQPLPKSSWIVDILRA